MLRRRSPSNNIGEYTTSVATSSSQSSSSSPQHKNTNSTTDQIMNITSRINTQTHTHTRQEKTDRSFFFTQGFPSQFLHPFHRRRGKVTKFKYECTKIRLFSLKSLLLRILMLIIILCVTTTSVYDFLFGIHPLPGGMIGRFIDCRVRAMVSGRTLKQAKRELEERNIHLPTTNNNGNSGTTLRELIWRATRRKEMLTDLMDHGFMHILYMSAGYMNIADTSNVIQQKDEEEWCNHFKLPRIMVRPSNLWNRSRSWSFDGGDEGLKFEYLDIDRGDVDGFLQDYTDIFASEMQMSVNHVHDHLPLSNFYDMYESMREQNYRYRDEFWHVYFLYKFGGVFDNTNRHGHVESTTIDQHMSSIAKFVQGVDGSHTCQEMGIVTIQNGILQTIAVTPGHSLLRCILDQIKKEWNSAKTNKVIHGYIEEEGSAGDEVYNDNDGSGSHSGVCTSPFHILLTAISTEEELKNIDNPLIRTVPLVKQPKCPQNLASTSNISAPKTDSKQSGSSSSTHENSSAQKYEHISVSAVISDLDQTGHNDTPQYSKKKSLDEKMYQQSMFCSGMWMWPCHRCLKSATHGTHKKCDFLCNPCFDNLFFGRDHEDHHKEAYEDVNVLLPINIQVRGLDRKQIPEQIHPWRKRIPRIIHQTWSEHISLLHYPQLYRVQNTWKSPSFTSYEHTSSRQLDGWTYKFYTDDEAREYIAKHFPPPIPFLEAYDALIPGAYKADLFRYLVLLKEGGIYADIDVMLDIGGLSSLDGFISPTMSFFAPRDTVAEYANGQYCLWNGLIGAAPGHPIIVKVVERLVNMILKRGDLLDIELDVLSSKAATHDTEIWKVRAVQELVLSGPCALGIALNEVMGNDPVARLDVGWLDTHMVERKTGTRTTTQDGNRGEYEHAHEDEGDAFDLGDIMILMTDKTDMGAMRFTDVERNIMFASTDMAGLTKDRVETRRSTDHSTPRYTQGTSSVRGSNEKLTTAKKKEEKDQNVKSNPHYKFSGRGSWLWGTRGVYKDQMASPRSVALNINFTE